jgi:hypothetical protein
MKRCAARLLALAVTLGLAGLARAKDETVSEADVPKAVKDSIQKKYPGATVSEFEKEEDRGALRYDAKVAWKTKSTEAGKEVEVVRRLEIELAADGRILEEEERLDPAKVPDAVTRALLGTKYEGMKVVRIDRVVKAENEKEARYGLSLEKGTEKARVRIDAAGKVTEDDDDRGGDDDGADDDSDDDDEDEDDEDDD